MRLADVQKSSLVVLASDWTYDCSFAMATYGNVYVKGPHQLGTTLAHALFVDGHVNWVHFSENASQYWQGDDWTMEAQ
jgi:prepilin-type processing-associated H-X9-DG protein